MSLLLLFQLNLQDGVTPIPPTPPIIAHGGGGSYSTTSKTADELYRENRIKKLKEQIGEEDSLFLLILNILECQ